MSSRALAGSAVTSVLVAGGIAGALDICYAMVSAVLRGRSAVGPVQAVASGAMGSAAFDGGLATFGLGLLLHFGIACAAAAVYFGASTRLVVLRDSVVLPGAIFGVGVYLFMNFVVLPLSAVPFQQSYPLAALVEGFLVHVLLVGLPIAAVVRRYWKTLQAAS